MALIVIDILGEPEEKAVETPKEPRVIPSRWTKRNSRLQKQVINIDGEIVSID